MNISASKSTYRGGAIMPLLALILPVLMLFAAFAINVAYMQLAATELQIATDSAGRAAGRMYALTGSESFALVIANESGALNRVAGENLAFLPGDLEFGQSTRAGFDSRYQFIDTNGVDTNAVRLTGRRQEGSASGSIRTYLPSFIGRGSFGIETSCVATQMEVDIALVFDRSGSMAYAADEPAVFPPVPVAAPAEWDFGDPAPPNSRWHDAVSAANTFLEILGDSPLNEQISLCTYADSGTVDVALTTNYPAISSGLDVYTNSLSGGGTNIHSGMLSGQDALGSNLARDFAAKVIIVMTDGRVTVGASPTSLASTLASEGVMVITVTFSDEADQVLMQNVADRGNGFHLHANNSNDLQSVFERIARELPSLLTE